MNVKISVFVICVKAIMYLLLYNIHTVPLKETSLEEEIINRHQKK